LFSMVTECRLLH